ncbi:histidine phosphatase family containing protein [Ceratobasidium sp. AG-Ba]|nr:histidine phosphatase family containing protein [Ceratobasidium sp. AG-Ba]
MLGSQSRNSLLASALVLGPCLSLASVSPSWVLQHLGNLSPYQKAPVPPGVQEALPSDCKVDQVFYMGRHGSRYPLASELVFIQGLSTKLAGASASIQKAHLPSELAFLKSGYNTTLGHDDLTPPGRRQLFDHGADFKLKYPQLSINELLVGGQDRVEESAQWWREGYFGRNWAKISTFTVIPENSKTISFITPSFTCPNWQYNYGNNLTIAWGAHYLPPITKRLNKAIPGANLTDADTHGALYACAYDTAAYGIDKSPWCGVFSQSEVLDFEYELDLLMVGAFGYGLPNDMGTVLGSTIVNKIIEVFTKSSNSLVSFGHDTTADFTLTALGLAKDKPALSPNVSTPKSNRLWRTTYQVPFGTQMLFEKFSCSSSAQGPQIRLVLNDSPFPMPACAKTSLDRKLGACSLDAFVKANAGNTAISWGDAKWNTTCGNPNI